jgi:DNA repair protein RecO
VSYHIYTTKGLVLSTRPIMEADRIYSILTEDLGLIYARAIGVRKEVSKLRASLEPFSFCSVSLVRGKEYWRITNASLILNLEAFFRRKTALVNVFAKVLDLVEKMVVGEHKHPELISLIENASNFIQTQNVSKREVEFLEIYLVANILAELGYLSGQAVSEGVLDHSLTVETLKIIEQDKKMIIKAINQGLKASHLIF